MPIATPLPIRRAAAWLALCLSLAAAPVHAQEAGDTSMNAATERFAQDEPTFQQHVEARLKQARSRGDKRAELLALRDKFTFVSDSGLIPHAQALDQALAMARELKDTATEAALLSARACLEEALSRRDSANEFHRAAVALVERSGDRDVQVAVFFEYGMYWHGNNQELALQWMERALTLSVERGEQARQALLLASISRVLRLSETSSLSDLAKIQEHLQRGISMLDPERHRRFLVSMLEDLGVTYLRQDKTKEARETWERGIALGEAMRMPVTNFQLQIGLLELKEGRPAPANEWISKALAGETDPSTWTSIRGTIAMARTQARLGNHATAWSLIERAEPLAKAKNYPKLDIELVSALAEVAALGANYKVAYDSVLRQRDMERTQYMGSSAKRLEELSVKFDLRLKDADNELLKARQANLESKRAMLAMGLVLSVLVVAGTMLFLFQQFRQRRRFETLALRDELTGAPNRRSVLEHLRREVARPAESRCDLTVSIMDIDFFKKVNDVHGHDAGDAVLKSFYAACKAKLRPDDVLGRWGGEEFVLVTRGADSVALNTLFERLSHAVKTMDVPELKGERTISFSMGACRVGEDPSPQLEAILVRADAALYEAKAGGRACWRMAMPGDEAHAASRASSACEASLKPA